MKFSITTTGWLKFFIGWSAVFLFRLIPLRPPNVEPMLATLMPFSKRYGPLGSFLFGFLGIVLFDLVTSGWGIWTLITALAYGALGPAAHFYFKKREATVKHFLIFGIVGTLAYDALTGLTIGPIFENQPFMLALLGQIPFTLLHLVGTIVFAVCLSPAIYHSVVQNEIFEISFLKNRILA
jgi:uncharacterized membrane protein